MSQHCTIEQRLAAGEFEAKLEQAPHTNGWRMPEYFAQMKWALVSIAERRERYPSTLWRVVDLKTGKVVA